LRESVLIKKLFLYLILPLSLLGILAAIYPVAYVILPVHDANVCWNMFDDHGELYSNFCDLHTVNDCSTIFFNWGELAILIYMVFLIRNIKEDLSIKDELIIIATLYFFLSLILALGYLGSNVYAVFNSYNSNLVLFIIV
jgi:hypothetical protein